jgi:ketosteroid isomerase-like protein
MVRAVLSLSLLLLTSGTAAADQPPAPTPPTSDRPPAAIVREWIERINALSDAAETLDRFAELYDAEALHIAGPTADQRGTATYRGHRGIRVWAARLAAREERRSYRLETETARETTATVIHEAVGPWGGPSVAVQIVATYTDAETQKRYAAPGAVFFQLAGGKIRRARVFIGDGERAEVEPEPTRRRP